MRLGGVKIYFLFFLRAFFPLLLIFFVSGAARASESDWTIETEKILAELCQFEIRGLEDKASKPVNLTAGQFSKQPIDCEFSLPILSDDARGISPEAIASLGEPAYCRLLPRVTEESSYALTFFADGMPRMIASELSKAVPFGGVSLDLDDSGTDGSAKHSLTIASEFLPSRWLREIASSNAGRGIRVRTSPRGWYSRGRIATNGLRTSLHELVHAYEDKPFPGLERELKSAFYETRTKGKKLRNLSRITNLYFYGAKEKYRGGFVWQYLGKEHGEELLSAGIECVMWNRFDIWNRDPELVKFLLGMMIFFGR
jgi:hypothetical protein